MVRDRFRFLPMQVVLWVLVNLNCCSITSKYNPISFLTDFRFPFGQLLSFTVFNNLHSLFICLCNKPTQILRDISPVIHCYCELTVPRAFPQTVCPCAARKVWKVGIWILSWFDFKNILQIELQYQTSSQQFNNNKKKKTPFNFKWNAYA